MKIVCRLAFVLFLFSSVSCKKDVDDIIDCIVESAFSSVSATADAGNPKLWTLVANYTGTYTISSVAWEFGDGQTGSNITTTHTYSAPGNYTVKAKITVKHGSSSCTMEPTKSITVN